MTAQQLLLLESIIILTSLLLCNGQSIVQQFGRCFEGVNVLSRVTDNRTGITTEFQCNHFIYYERIVDNQAAIDQKNKEGLIILAIVLTLFFILPCVIVCIHAGCNAKRRSEMGKLMREKWAANKARRSMAPRRDQVVEINTA